MKTRIALTLLLLVLAVSVSPRPNAAVATHDAEGCLEIYVFASGETLHICPPPPATATTAPTDVPGATETVAPTDTPLPPTVIPPTVIPPTATTGAAIAPFASAPLCQTHDTHTFHTLWNSVLGCHYDHEHGQNPFTAEVAAMFAPLGNLQEFLGGVQVGHTNPSSPVENTDKHGGFKWNVQLVHPEGCTGFTGAATGVNGSVIQYHGFGDYAIEAEARLHSTVAFLRQCRTSNPGDYGYVAVNQLQDYGQRIAPYQGDLLPYPNQPSPSYPTGHAPYLSIDCIGVKTGTLGPARPPGGVPVFAGRRAKVWRRVELGEPAQWGR